MRQQVPAAVQTQGEVPVQLEGVPSCRASWSYLALKAQSRQEAAAWGKSGVVNTRFVNLQLVQDAQKMIV